MSPTGGIFYFKPGRTLDRTPSSVFATVTVFGEAVFGEANA